MDLRLGQYQVSGLLGAGGMGTVYRCRHARLGREVAVKIIDPGLVDSDVAKTRFVREVEAVGHLQHEHIVQATDAGEEDGIVYLVMELIDGYTVRELTDAAGRLPPPLACMIIRQAALGLSYAHDHGIIHRDIKPSNLMISGNHQGDLTTKILDFGLAKIQRDPGQSVETLAGSLLGTIRYMSPEQVRGTSDIDARTDVYSLGITLFHLLSGKMPFEIADDSNAIHYVSAILHGDRAEVQSFVSDLDSGLAAIVADATHPNAEDRIASCHELVARLEPYTSHFKYDELMQLYDLLLHRQADPGGLDDLAISITMSSAGNADASTVIRDHKDHIVEPANNRRLMWAVLAFVSVAAGVAMLLMTNRESPPDVVDSRPSLVGIEASPGVANQPDVANQLGFANQLDFAKQSVVDWVKSKGGFITRGDFGTDFRVYHDQDIYGIQPPPGDRYSRFHFDGIETFDDADLFELVALVNSKPPALYHQLFLGGTGVTADGLLALVQSPFDWIHLESLEIDVDPIADEIARGKPMGWKFGETIGGAGLAKFAALRDGGGLSFSTARISPTDLAALEPVRFYDVAILFDDDDRLDDYLDAIGRLGGCEQISIWNCDRPSKDQIEKLRRGLLGTTFYCDATLFTPQIEHTRERLSQGPISVCRYLRLTRTAPAEYSLRMRLRRTGEPEAIAVGFPVGNQTAAIVLGGQSGAHIRLVGRSPDELDSIVADGNWHDIQIHVTPNTIQLSIDGKMHVDFIGNPATLEPVDYWSTDPGVWVTVFTAWEMSDFEIM